MISKLSILVLTLLSYSSFAGSQYFLREEKPDLNQICYKILTYQQEVKVDGKIIPASWNLSYYYEYNQTLGDYRRNNNQKVELSDKQSVVVYQFKQFRNLQYSFKNIDYMLFYPNESKANEDIHPFELKYQHGIYTKEGSILNFLEKNIFLVTGGHNFQNIIEEENLSKKRKKLQNSPKLNTVEEREFIDKLHFRKNSSIYQRYQLLNQEAKAPIYVSEFCADANTGEIESVLSFFANSRFGYDHVYSYLSVTPSIREITSYVEVNNSELVKP